MAHRAADVGLGVFGDRALVAGFGILREQRRGVAAAAVVPVERPAVGGVAGHAGRKRVLQTSAFAGLFRDPAGGDFEHVGAALAVLLHGVAKRQTVVGDEADVTADVLEHAFE